MKSPRSAKTFKQIYALNRDNLDVGGFWILLNQGSIILAKQKLGHSCEVDIKIPRKKFNRMINWYNRRTPRAAKKRQK